MNELSPWRIRRVSQNEEIQPEFSRVSEPDEIPVSHYWNIIVKRRNVILPVFLVVFTVGAYTALSATKLYTATAKIKIEPQNPKVTGVGELQPLGLGGGYDYHKTQFALLKSRALAATVITELDLESNQMFANASVVTPNPIHRVKAWIFWPLRFFSSYATSLFKSELEKSELEKSELEKSEPEMEESDTIQPAEVLDKLAPELRVSPNLIGRYLGFLNIEPIQQTRLVNIEFRTPDPALSQALANTHVHTFLRMSEENRFNLTEGARKFLEQKKAELQKKLERSEAELNSFERTYGVLAIGGGQNIVVDRLVDLNRRLTDARALRLDAESLYQTVDNRSHQDLTEVMRQGLVQQIKSNLANLEAESARLAKLFKPDHPRMQELNHQIAAARQALNNEIANVVRGIRSNYAAALAKERALQSEVEKQQREALKLRESGVQYTLLQEEVNADRSLYESVLKRLTETSVVNDVAVSNMQVVERAAKPRSASGPNVPILLLASIASGLFLGVGAAFVREFLDSIVRTPDDVWRSVGLGTLGAVPHSKFINRPTYRERLIKRREQFARLPASRVPVKELIIHSGSLSIMNEAYRRIRTFLLLSQADKPPQVILVTSPSPGEGKTVTSLNLAIALARDDHNVLLVDADMRRGCCHNRLGLTNNRGLSNVLTGGLSLDDGVQDTPVSGLSLLSRGVPPPNPSELLGSRKMRDILKELRQRFDFILIDSPPVIAISDAAILSVVTDGVVLVFDGQKTSTASAQKAVELLDTVRARILGVILNAVDLDNPDYSYHRTYSHYDQDSTENDDLNKRNADESEEDCAKPFGSEMNEEGKFETAYTHSKLTSPYRGKPDGTVSQVFLNRLMDVFVEAIGPLGPLIIHDQIAVLGESQNAFPKSRIDELVKSIAPEILNSELRSRFEKKISEEIRNLERN